MIWFFMFCLKSSKEMPCPWAAFSRDFHVGQVHLLAHIVEALDDFGIGRDAEILAFIHQELLVDQVAQHIFLALDELLVGGRGILLLQAVRSTCSLSRR